MSDCIGYCTLIGGLLKRNRPTHATIYIFIMLMRSGYAQLSTDNVAGGCYFFTVNLLERQRTLLTDHIDLLRDSVRRVRRLHPFHIDAWVVLPDHLHCIWTLPPDTDDFPMRWRLIKLLFSKGLPRTERLSATRQRRSERGIWQRRYWEHTIVTERDYAQHIDYIHVNPLKHGYVKQRVGCISEASYTTLEFLPQT